MVGNRNEAGHQIAGNLAGSWCFNPPPKAKHEMPTAVAALLLQTGAGGLAWWALQNASGQTRRACVSLRQAFANQSAQRHLHEQRLALVVRALRTDGCEPILVKGWSVARLYAADGLRPCGDIDLCVAPRQLPLAKSILAALGADAADVDLHGGVADLDRGWEQVYDRSRLVSLGTSEIRIAGRFTDSSSLARRVSVGTPTLTRRASEDGQRIDPLPEIRILGAEDQLRHLCLHMMRHGAFRPVWLCDIGAALDSLPADFDWKYCLEGERWLSEWVIAAVQLAHDLLGAKLDASMGTLTRRASEVSRTVLAGASGWSRDSRRASEVSRTVLARASGWTPRDLPAWVPAAVLRNWSRGSDSSDVVGRAWSAYPRNWTGLRDGLRCRWPNPLRAAFHLRLSPFTSLPPLLLQITAFLRRTGSYALRRLRPPGKVNPDLLFSVHSSRVY